MHEDDICIAFLDISPVSKGHTLLVSKQPYPWMTDVPENTVAHMFITAQKIMRAMKSGIDCDYIQVGVIGKDVPHFHIHLIPRYITPSHDDIPPEMRHHEPYANNEEKSEYCEKIKNAL